MDVERRSEGFNSPFSVSPEHSLKGQDLHLGAIHPSPLAPYFWRRVFSAQKDIWGKKKLLSSPEVQKVQLESGLEGAQCEKWLIC